MPTRTNVSIHHDVINKALACKPNRKSLTQFLEDVIEEALDTGFTMARPAPQARGPHEEGRPFQEIKEEERVRAREEQAPVPAWDKIVVQGLTPHEDLIRDFWRTKKGSKGQRAWTLLMGQLTALQERYGASVVKEQLELAINGRWASITVTNYERFKPQQAFKEPEPKHPAYRVFTSDGNGGTFVEEEDSWPESQTGGKGVLEALGG